MTTYDRPPLVLVDMDGVQSDLVAGFWGIWAQAHPEAPQQADADPTQFYIENQLPSRWLTQAREIIDTPGFNRNLPVVPGAVQAMNEMLDAGLDVRICTAPNTRNPACASDKLAWADAIVGAGWAERTIIVRDKSVVRGDILIDDKPIIPTTLTPTWRHVVFDAPHNQDTPAPHRLYGWANWQTTLLPLLGRIAA